MSDIPCEKSPYSLHFNKLRIMGAWVIKSPNRYLQFAYMLFKSIMTTTAICSCSSFYYDLYMVFGDFRKTTWNLCISTLFSASLLKNLFTVSKGVEIDALREGLHTDSLTKMTPEYDAIHKLSLRELRLIQVFFYGLASIFVPTWLLTIYSGSFMNPKEMPIPMRLPIQIDVEDDFQYNMAFWMLGSLGVLGILLVLETELAMFTILIQISRGYNLLLKDICKLNDVYEGEDGWQSVKNKECVKEVNPVLRNNRTKTLMKEYSTRQQKLIEYTEGFEQNYSLTLLLQIFAMTVLMVVSAIQCILEFGNLSMNVTYQIGYMSIIMMDMFLVCWFATRIRTQCLEVGEEAYYTLWYRMNMDIQKDICMMIMRSQRPPKITSGKVMELNLHAFMHTLRNIYSWLALFQQLAQKVN